MSKSNFIVFLREVRVLSILCSFLLLMAVSVSCQKGEDEAVSKETVTELSQEVVYTLDDKEIMEAIRSGVTMDEINFLMYIARRANKPVSELVALKIGGCSISEIDKQFPEGSEGLNHQSGDGAKGYFILSDPRREKSVTNFRISDFRNIGYGMTVSQVRAILDGRRPNKYEHTNTIRDVDIYELVEGGEVWISYNKQGEDDPVFRVEGMGYSDPKEPNKSIMLIKKLDMAQSNIFFKKTN